MTKPDPRSLIQQIEREVMLPSGSDERFSGYGVMGLPFASGHILALRRFPASSIGPAYTSVWHRAPDGRWTFYQNVPARQACARFFGSAVAEAIDAKIDIDWPGPRSLAVRMRGGATLDWDLELAESASTRLLNGMGALMPDALWRSELVLRAMAPVAGLLLRAGRLRMAGRAPNGQRFIANPRRLWVVSSSRAVLDGEDFGPVGPAPEQGRLGDFWIPQRGIVAVGRSFFEPFDEQRHLATTSQASEA